MHRVRVTKKNTIILCIALSCIIGCTKNNQEKKDIQRSFYMGFSTMSYEMSTIAVESTYDFISTYSDIYSEQIEDPIPWENLISNDSIPHSIKQDWYKRAAKKTSSQKLLLSVGLLNVGRTDLQISPEGNTPSYNKMYDSDIINAYTHYVSKLITIFNPDYVVLAMEVNDLLINAPEKWEEYKILISGIRENIQKSFPNLPLSESVSLHNWVTHYKQNEHEVVEEIANYVNKNDFISISFYPFFKYMNTTSEFSEAFTFLQKKSKKPIAIVETNYITETLELPSYNITIPANETEQYLYLKTLLNTAQKDNYLCVIWWAHRDYDNMMSYYPYDLQELASIWLRSGLLTKDGKKREVFYLWEKWLKKAEYKIKPK